jgi:hypothetical protein
MDQDDCPERTSYVEHQKHVGRMRPPAKAVIAALAACALALAYLSEVGPSASASHKAFLEARPDLRGREWKGEAATLFRDPSDPRALHVCTPSGCEEIRK